MPRGWLKAGIVTAVTALVAALAATPAQAAPTDVVASPVAAGASSPAATARYWTARRMREARPVEGTLSRSQAPTRASAPGSSGAPRYVAGTDAPFQTELGDPSVHPGRTHGKVFFKLGRNSWVCSATVVHSKAENVVVTAGHCVHGGGRNKDFATKWVFVPGYEEGKRPFGKFPFRRLYALRGWTRRANFNFDVATAVVKANRSGQRVEQAVGSRGISWDVPPDGLDFDIYGYPVAGASFDHGRLYVCRTSFALRDPAPAGRGPAPIGAGCDLTKGASGGGWVTDQGTGADPFVNSVTSFSYDDYPDILFGPYFAAETAGKLWSRASDEPLTTASPLP
jgi:hypothetical protein